VSLHKRRIRTIQAIVSSIPCIAGHAKQQAIADEFGEVHLVRKIRRDTRRRILEVLHSTRALDTTLSAFVGHHGCLPRGGRTPSNLGAYLIALRDHTVSGLSSLNETQRSHFQKVIVRVRNAYMHEAGALPQNDSDVHVLLAEMQACIAIVARL
jgi:hypothetical protein